MPGRIHRVLVAGTGSIGERHVRCFLATGRAAAGICELDDASRKAVAERYSIRGIFAELDKALEQEWDAALIATPAHTHIPIARTIVKHDIPILIEKPLSVNMDGIPELLAAVESRSLLAAVSYNYRAHPALVAMKSAIGDGRFGRALQMYCVVGQNFATYRPAYASVYFANRGHGGGAIQDAMTHLINMGEWLAGPVDRINVDADHLQLEGVDVEDTVHVFARHGKIMASYVLNLFQRPNESSITVVCEKATLRFDMRTGWWRWMDAVDGEWHDEVHALKDRDDLYVLNATAFLDALEGISPPLCTLGEGVQTLRTNLAALASMDSGQWQQVNAEKS